MLSLIRKYKLQIVVAFIAIFISYLIFYAKHRADIKSSFETAVYYAQVIQVGGVGSDIYTNRAFYVTLPDNLDKDSYAPVSFNSSFDIMYLNCKEGYEASVIPIETTDEHS